MHLAIIHPITYFEPKPRFHPSSSDTFQRKHRTPSRHSKDLIVPLMHFCWARTNTTPGIHACPFRGCENANGKHERFHQIPHPESDPRCLPFLHHCLSMKKCGISPPPLLKHLRLAEEILFEWSMRSNGKVDRCKTHLVRRKISDALCSETRCPLLRTACPSL